MNAYDDERLRARFAALAPVPLTGNWNDVLGRARAAPTGRQAVERRGGRSRWRLLALAMAVLIVVAATASAFATVRDLFFGRTRTAWGGAPTWSPDGREIAYVVHSRPAWRAEVYVMNADGSGQRNLTSEWGRDVSPIWSPDMRKVAFVSDPCAAVRGACSRTSQIYVMNADGSGVHRVAHGGKVRRIFSGQGLCPCGPSPAWSPDGRRLAFGSEQDGSVDVYLVNADGSGQRRLTRGTASGGSLAWSPDGRRIAYVRERDRRSEIVVMNAGGGEQRLLARGRAPAWSPDGRKIAFRSDRDGQGEIYVMNADGTGLRRLTRNPASDGGPVWSPDGRKILFGRGEFRRGNTEIHVINADGSGQRNLTRDKGRDSSWAWSPDGRRIAFASKRSGHGEIYVMNADGSGVRKLTQLKGGS